MATEHAAHPDSVLLDEPTTADLRAKVTQAWRDFAEAMAERVATLPAGARLELILDPTATGTGDALYAVTVHVEEDGQLLARAVGNADLPEGYRMDRAAVADLVALGWSPPGVAAGSGDQFGLRTSTAGARRLATIISRTMRDVYGAPHPAFLVYLVNDRADEPIQGVPLGTARPEVRLVPGQRSRDAGSGVRDAEEVDAAGRDDLEDTDDEETAAGAVARLDLHDQVRTVVASLLKNSPEQLQVDADGDIGIRAGSAMVFVRVRENPALVDVFSPVLTSVRPTEQLYVKLSELTNRMPIGRLYCTEDTVWASIPVFGRDFQATHLMLAIQVMTGLADELDDRLHGEFGGKRFFGEGDKVTPHGDAERTGMYL